jgi:hypothetical protein
VASSLIGRERIERGPRVLKTGEVPNGPDSMPDEMEYDEARRRLLVGKGFIERVPPAVWNYEVSGKRVLMS